MGAKSADEIKYLPGFDDKLPSKVYAGYLPAGSDEQDGTTYTMHEHYMFIESEGNPQTDPVLLWTNGGPGASSFFGLFVELGPFMLDDASMKTKEFNKTKVPTLWRNEYSWTKVASVLILNSPPPVGYSYCDPIGPTGNGSSCGSWNDTRTATHNYEFMLSFFDAYPEFKSNDLYLSGESYAGIYVPTLARLIYTGKQLNLKGFAVGDGVLGKGDFGNGWHYYSAMFMHGHGQFSDLLWEQIVSVCTLSALKNNATISDPACQKLLDQIDEEVGGYYSYNLYDECWYENDLLAPGHGIGAVAAGHEQRRDRWDNSWDAHQQKYYGPPVLTGPSPQIPRGVSALPAASAAAAAADGEGFGAGLNDYPCGGPRALNAWVNHPKVKEALHVAPDAFFFSGDDGVGFTYNSTEPSLLPFYKEMQASPIRVLIYNGDTDPGLNSFLGQSWTDKLGFPTNQTWRPWTLDGRQRMGGYVTRYEGDFDFLTIRGSGHMVPEFKPAATLAFLKAWLSNEDWKKYLSPPTTHRQAP